MSVNRWISFLVGALALSAMIGSFASAQEIEPNNLCFGAQDGGTIAPPAFVSGAIDFANTSPLAFSDVDFYRFTAAPGLALTAAVGFSQRVGLFDDACLIQAASDPFSFVENQIEFTVPESGSFILAVADRSDFGFSGFGSNSGPYQLSIALQPPSIGSISGRLVDAVSRTPLVGATTPFARVELRRCLNGSCFELVNSQNADAVGMFRFELDSRGRRIRVGDFQLTASAEEFQPATLIFSVNANQNQEVGDVALIPPPILFSNIRPCAAILPQGGVCQYSVRIRNNTTAKFTGQALSQVIGGLGSTRFEASTQRNGVSPVRAPVTVPELGSRDVTFFFNVPSFVPNGTTVCTQLQLGLDPSPLFNVARQRDLFCLAKGGSGFWVMSAEESRAVFDLMKGTDALPAQPLK
jgi:hypothetical protein